MDTHLTESTRTPVATGDNDPRPSSQVLRDSDHILRRPEDHQDRSSARSFRSSAPETGAIPSNKDTKATVEAVATQHPVSSESSSTHSRGIHPEWRPSLLQLGPLLGLAALVFAFLQILASYAVLAASNGDLVDNWNVQPTVYLAIFTALGNKTMAFATIQVRRNALNSGV